METEQWEVPVAGLQWGRALEALALRLRQVRIPRKVQDLLHSLTAIVTKNSNLSVGGFKCQGINRLCIINFEKCMHAGMLGDRM